MSEQADISSLNLIPREAGEPSRKLLGPGLQARIQPMEPHPSIAGKEEKAIICFDCGKIFFVPVRAISTQCPYCSAHMRLEDMRVTSLTRRTRIKTQGAVHVESDVLLSGLTIICKSLVLDGWVSGPIFCLGDLFINRSGVFDTSVQAHTLHVPKKVEVAFHQSVRLKSALIEGKVTGNIQCEGTVALGSDGVLMGDVVASKMVVPLGASHKGKFRPHFSSPNTP